MNSNESTKPTNSIPLAIKNEILASLKPNPLKVFMKLALVQLIVSFFSLSVCHQFGVNPFNTTWSLDRVVMDSFGHHLCMVFCGLFFISVGILISGFIFTLEEIITIQRNRTLHLSSIILVSASFLVILGAEVSFMIFALWLIGAAAGAVTTFQTLRYARLAMT